LPSSAAQKEKGLFKGRECIEFNNNASNVMTAVIEEHIFLEVSEDHRWLEPPTN
jgi:hypothetical protein